MKNLTISNHLLDRGVFFLNFLFVVAMILIFYFQLELKYFFYGVIITTFIFSYLTFSKYRKFSKGIILSNLFIYFYFLYPYIAEFFSQINPQLTNYILILYTLFLALILLEFLGKKNEVLQTIYNVNFKRLLQICLFAIPFGILFYLVGEPIPREIFSIDSSLINTILHALFVAFLIGVSEQFLFTGFVHNMYSTMTSKVDAQIQTSILFVLFHMLRIKVIMGSFVLMYNQFAYLMILCYFLALFIFMNISIYLFRGSKHFKGSIVYSVLFHTLVDFILILTVILS
ncbi:MAG: hypothetical protein ACLFPL_02225 [Candidatus Nanoarchaeia archaeon]